MYVRETILIRKIIVDSCNLRLARIYPCTINSKMKPGNYNEIMLMCIMYIHVYYTGTYTKPYPTHR